MISRLCAASLLLGLAGCATHFDKPGASQQDFARDSYACQHDMYTAGAGMTPGPFKNLAMQNLGEQCMASKGWAKQ